jgi:hypothetical protein
MWQTRTRMEWIQRKKSRLKVENGYLRPVAIAYVGFRFKAKVLRWRPFMSAFSSRSCAVALMIFPALAILSASSLIAGSPPGDSSNVKIARVDHAPAFQDFLSMKPSSETTAHLTKIEGLIQRIPSDGAPVSQRTIVYLGYDAKNIYAIFLCFDETPGKIRAHLANRDKFPGDDDAVALQFDTFHDRTHAYGFETNPLGVQMDGIWTEGQSWDLSFDTLWYSRGQLTNQGYVAMITVPFKSLRFQPEDVQSWGFFVWRGIPRNNEDSYWPAYSSRLEGRLNQAADLAGLEKISPSRGMQFIPYASLLSSRDIDARDPAAPRFLGKSGELNAGLDSKFVIHKSLVLDVTVNPDFSQVESDEPQTTANQRFEVFFPEKRPFFIENASYFNTLIDRPIPLDLLTPINSLTPISLLFTRRIADPQFGARLTGKLGPYAIGALVADDRSPGEILPLGSPFAGSRALFSALSFVRDIGKGSSVGVIYSSRVFQGDSNFVGGVDGRFKWNSNWVASFLAVNSSTTLQGGTHFAGPAYEASLLRSGRQFSYQFQFGDRSPGFQSEAGFVNRVDIRQVSQTISYRFRPEGKHLISWGPDLLTSNIWDHRNVRLDESYTPMFTLEFPHQTQFIIFHTFRQETVRPQDFSSLTRTQSFQEGMSGVSFSTSFLKQIALSGEYSIGKGINFVPPSKSSPYSADASIINGTLSVRPRTSLTVDNTYLLTRLVEPRSGRAVFNDHILRSKWNYQFTRALSLRAIVQYNATIANQALTSFQTSKRLVGDLLFTYLVHPGTALYVGYNSSLSNIDPALIPTNLGLLRRNGPLINDGRQFFVKVSYLFRY